MRVPKRVSRRFCIRRLGISMTEVLVAIAVIALLMAILIPAVQSVRATARRMQCSNHQRQLLLGLASYHETYGVFPAWSLGGGTPECGGQTALTALFPFAGIGDRCDAIAAGVRQLPLLTCPADVEVRMVDNALSYSINASAGRNSGSTYKGPFDGACSTCSTREGDIVDGLSNTAGISENIAVRSGGTNADADQNPMRYRWIVVAVPVSANAIADPTSPASLAEWGDQTKLTISDCMHGPRSFLPMPFPFLGQWGQFGGTLTYSHWLPPNTPQCSTGTVSHQFIDRNWRAASGHKGGVNVGFLDGHVRFVSDQIDQQVWRAAGTTNGGETVSEALQ